MNVFVEQIVKKEKNKKDSILKVLIILIAVFLCFITTAINTSMLGYLRPVIWVMIGYFAYLLIGNLNIEFEYCVTNEYILIDKIMSQRKRKTLVNMDLKNTEVMKAVDINNIRGLKQKNVKFIYAVGNPDWDDEEECGIYCIQGRVAEKKYILIIQPNEKTLEALKTYLGKKFAS